MSPPIWPDLHPPVPHPPALKFYGATLAHFYLEIKPSSCKKSEWIPPPTTRASEVTERKQESCVSALLVTSYFLCDYTSLSPRSLSLSVFSLFSIAPYPPHQILYMFLGFRVGVRESYSSIYRVVWCFRMRLEHYSPELRGHGPLIP